MRRSFALALALIGLMLSATVAVAGASTKFSSTEGITDTGSLVVGFEEGSLKRFSAVDYRLDATAITIADLGGGYSIGVLTTPTAGVTLTPDPKGRTAGSLTLLVTDGGGCTCGALKHVEYTDVTLTNLTTGHVYRLEPISREFPT